MSECERQTFVPEIFLTAYHLRLYCRGDLVTVGHLARVISRSLEEARRSER
jgi:hypothetical protein